MATFDPPFDDEDLIGDYYDDEDDNCEPPPEFESDFEDDIDVQGVEISGVQQRQETTKAVESKMQTTVCDGAIPPLITFDRDKCKSISNDDENKVGSKVTKDKSLYSFDRCVDFFQCFF